MSAIHRLGKMQNFTFFLGVFLSVICLVVLLNVFLSHPTSALQTVPHKLNYQGRLTDAAGAAKPDGQYNMTFRLYSVASGGTAIWTEVRETTNRVTVTGGQFAVQLGDVTTLSPSVFTSQPLYFEIELPTPASATCSTAACAVYTEGAMTPRQTMASSAYAMNADTLDGYDSSDFIVTSQNNTYTGTNLFKNATNSTAAFGVQDVAGTSLLNVDTTNSKVTIGNIYRAPESVGNATVGAQNLTLGVNRAAFLSFLSGSTGGSVATIQAYADGTTLTAAPYDKYKLAIYTDGPTGPDTLVSTSAEGTLVAGWNALPIHASLAPDTEYWLAYITNGQASGDNNLRATSTYSGGVEWNDMPYANGFTQTPSGGSGSSTYYPSMYMTYESGNTPILGSDSAGRIGINTASPTAQLSAMGSGLMKNVTNGTTAFRVQSSSALNMFTIDTTNNAVQVGSSTGDATAILLGLDRKNETSTDPPGTNGGMYYNEVLSKFRCYQNGSWRNCRGAPTHVVTLTSDVVNNNSTANTMQDVTGLAFPVVGGVKYNFVATIHYTAAATTTGSRWSLNGPNTTSGTPYYSRYVNAATPVINYQYFWDMPAAATTASQLAGNVATIKGVYDADGTGTLQVRFASEVSGSAITAKAGSRIVWW